MKGTGLFAHNTPFEINIGINFTRLVYANRIEVRCDSLDHKNVHSGKVIHEDYFDGKGGWIVNDKGVREEYPLVDEDSKTRAEVWFGKPILTIEVNSKGEEMKSTYSQHPAAEFFIQNGSLENLFLFQGRYPDPSGKWARKVVQPGASGGKVSGEFHYEKTEATQPVSETTSYTVKGELLDPSESSTAEGTRTRNSKTVFNGTCTFDPQLKEWVSGELKSTMTMELWNGEKWEEGKSEWVLNLKSLKKPK